MIPGACVPGLDLDPRDADLAGCLRVLRALAEDPGRCAEPGSPAAEVLRLAAELLRSTGVERRREHRRRDAELIEATGIRSRRASRGAPARQAAIAPDPAADADLELGAPRRCYVCKRPYARLHAFYDALCTTCGDVNEAKRRQSADMAGMIALVTGARIKIGFQVALKLLRAGAWVIATTRFPVDAARRYGREGDFDDWRDRLTLHAIDLRRLGDVERFAASVVARSPRLDVLINNAAQTIRRPPSFYEHLIDAERQGREALPAAVRGLIGPAHLTDPSPGHPAHDGREQAPRLAAELTPFPATPEDAGRDRRHFPVGALDDDGQQVDRRPRNSWDNELGEISTCELLEVHAVNGLAPFLLIRGLEPILRRDPGRGKFIVNVSAVEGQFDASFKSGCHPHTNMAKAALNMITRTCAERFARAGIFMNSVDTGWVTNEAPHPRSEAMAARGFQPPLDEIDAAARVCDPIFHGLNTGRFESGQFLKDYRAIAW